MQKALIFKFATIIGLCALFLFGLMFVTNLVSERQSYYRTVMDDIKKTHVNDQYIGTPFVAIANAQGVYIPQFATASDITSQANVSNNDYKRSIYHAISYNSDVTVNQSFNFQPVLTQLAPLITRTDTSYSVIPSEPITPVTTTNPTNKPKLQPASTDKAKQDKTNSPPRHYQWQTTKLIIPVSDLRGVNLPKVTINGKSYNAQFPKQKDIKGLSYVEVSLADLVKDDVARQSLLTTPVKVQFQMTVAGIDSFNILPLGDQFGYKLQANWREPKFFGDALPTKQFTPAGFSASWQNQFLATHNNQQISECLFTGGSTGCNLIDPMLSEEPLVSGQVSSSYKWLSTSYVDSNNTYTLTDRTLKYALLLMLVSFGTFFLFEVLKNLRIHPVQYGLVAAALLVFYVLLLSFAEHIAFWQAYLVASAACVGLIGWYASYVLHSVKRSLGFSIILSSLYAGFYLILASEGMNLLLGAVFCFALLAIVMFLTRKIDWYKVGENRNFQKPDNPSNGNPVIETPIQTPMT